MKQADDTEGIQSEELEIVEDVADETSEVIEESEVQDNQEVEDEVVVSIDGESPPQEVEQTKAPEWVRELRKSHRDLQRQNRELQSRLESFQKPEQKIGEPGPKPKLEQFDYDADLYEQKLEQWHEQKRKFELEVEKLKQEQAAQDQVLKDRLEAYSRNKAELKVKDYEDAEATAQELFNVTQQWIIVRGANNPALLVYALGKNPKKAAELAKLNDPVEFAFAVARLEKDLKVTNRKSAPAPEKIVQNSGRVVSSASVDSTLNRLRAEAERTGDYTKVMEYRRQKRN
jgi:hypothetical protein